MKKTLKYIILAILCTAAISCGKRYVPKPYGYVRGFIPDTAYTMFDYSGVCSFLLSNNAVVKARKDDKWSNICYPALKATIHCSYAPVKENLRELTDDAQEFVYNHSSIATAISEQAYFREKDRVYCVLYELDGNTASPCQFYITDSLSNFFRASVYFDCLPNRDSLQPSIDYLHTDIIRLIESFQWNK